MLPSCHIAVVAPIYEGAAFVAPLCERLHAALAEISADYRIVLIDDGSPDDSWRRIEEQAALDSRVVGVQLSRNFGQQYAITAGLDQVDADWVVVMDGDLQDRPEDIGNLYRHATELGFDVVIAERSVREDPLLRRIASELFNRTFALISGLRVSSRHGNFRIMNRRVHAAFLQLREQMRVYVAIMQWVGFRVGYQQSHRQARTSGRSGYSFWRLVRLALHASVAYSERPLQISIFVGFAIATVAFSLGALIIARKVGWGIDIEGWASLFTLISFIGGLQILFIGVLGLYVGKAFQESKRRPLYLVRATTGEALERSATPSKDSDRGLGPTGRIKAPGHGSVVVADPVKD